MRLKKLELRNFRCFADLSVSLSTYDCFIGQNNSGKSTILRSVDVFFESTPKLVRITKDDFHDSEKEAKIVLTFDNLSEAAEKDFAHYLRGGELTFYIKARLTGDALEASIHGVRYVMSAFAPFFEVGSAADKRVFYRSIQADYSFPDWTNKDAAEDTIR